MFTPRELQLERGWPGIIEGDTVVQLAAQTLPAFFTGGGSARRHAEYRLAEVGKGEQEPAGPARIVECSRERVKHPGAAIVATRRRYSTRIGRVDRMFVTINPRKIPK